MSDYIFTGREKNTKNLIFEILSNEYPLKLIELVNIMRRRYGKSVTFQAVRKAAIELVEIEILVVKDKTYSINKEWVLNKKKSLDDLYIKLTKTIEKSPTFDTIQNEISIFTFDTLNEMMKFWQDILLDWHKNFRKSDYKYNCYQGGHAWEALLHSEAEASSMGNLIKKGVKSYALSIGATPLDRYIWTFYGDVGVKVAFLPSQSSFDNSHYIATYGDVIIQVKYPPEIVKALDNFFKKHKTIASINMTDLSKIANKKVKLKMTVIKNKEMAKQINQSIIQQIEN